MVRLLGGPGTRSTSRPGGQRDRRTADRVRRARESRRAGPARQEPAAGLRSALGGRSVAGQVFVLLVVAAVGALVLQVHHDSTQEARNRSLAVAETFANAPGLREALSAPDPTAVLQPRAEAARKTAHVDFMS